MIGQTIYLALGYTLIFAGFYEATSFLTILYGDNAFISFAIFPGVYSIFSLCSPYIVSKLNLRLSIAISSFSYLLFCGAIGSLNLPLMLAASGICGAFNAIFWLCQALWMINYPVNERSSLIGLFFGIFGANIIIGNIIALIVLLTGLSVQIMIWIMVGVVGIGVVMLIFIPPFSYHELFKIIHKNDQQINLVKSIKDVFTIVLEKRGYLLIPMFIVQAADLNVSFQIITRLLIVNSHGNKLVNIYNAAMYLAYGITSAISAVLFGKIYSKFGWQYVLISYSVLNIICIIGIILLATLSSNGPMELWIIIGSIKGIVDYALNILINVPISNTYQDKANLMFGLYRFVYPIANMLISIMVGYIWYPWILLINGICVIITAISLWIFLINDDIEVQFDRSSITISNVD
ncbi:hypothetical protein Indivirus_4_25 [Indivirus ILV1]|uniref:UNC93-like protein MFSD11 n=1 Tax=Indivirus ILV1 TaxID=1977633 RepID=A0A1V0SDQ6_9VIRU|nr:hypothetical protein Indivirus_4_25 [Indivirus ILV1]